MEIRALGCERKETKGAGSGGPTQWRAVVFHVCFDVLK